MKPKHYPAYRLDAIATLEMIGASVGQDFHTLAGGQVTALLREADRVRYQQPKHANGSRARYFYDRLQRHAVLKDKAKDKGQRS